MTQNLSLREVDKIWIQIGIGHVLIFVEVLKSSKMDFDSTFGLWSWLTDEVQYCLLRHNAIWDAYGVFE